MAEIDPVTGLPKNTEVDEGTGLLRERGRVGDIGPDDRLQAQKGRGDQMQEALSSEKGQLVIRKIEEQFLARVSELINGDGECKAFMRVLRAIGSDLNMGEVAVGRLMRFHLKGGR